MGLKLEQKTINYLSFLILFAGIIFISGCIEQQPIVPPSKKIIFTPPAELTDATEGVPYSYTFCEPDSARSGATCGALAGATTNPTGGNPPYSFTVESGAGFTPPGMALELNGLLRGTPTLPGTYTFGICANDRQNEVCKTTSLTVKPKSGSPYDGTYTGTFIYEYPSNKNEWGNAVPPMAQGSFTLTITLKTRAVTPYTIYLNVTNVVSSKPEFGTGPNGIALKHGEVSTRAEMDEGYGYARLPAKFPSTAEDDTPRYIVIGFPNGKILRTSQVYIGLDPNTLTYYPDDSEIRWNSDAPFWDDAGLKSNEGYLIEPLSWSLTKVSS